MFEEEEVYRVLDPHPPNRGVNEAPVVDENAALVSEENANVIEVVRNSGAAEEGLLPKNTVKAKLIRRTEEELKRNIDVENLSGNVKEESEALHCETEESYASRAARTTDQSSRVNRNVNSVNNKLPGRPCTASFTPNNSTNASSVFEALDKAKINEKDILCLHRRQGGEVQITFRSRALKEKFLALNSITIDNGIYALQDVDRPLTFLTLYDAPYELPDLAIIKRLEPYCEVLHSRRGRYSLRPSVCNGLRHYRVRIIKPILAPFWCSCDMTGNARRVAATISRVILPLNVLTVYALIVSR